MDVIRKGFDQPMLSIEPTFRILFGTAFVYDTQQMNRQQIERKIPTEISNRLMYNAKNKFRFFFLDNKRKNTDLSFEFTFSKKLNKLFI